jgi:hypothetical protein
VLDIREERPDDIPAIREVNKRAFGQTQEANIVDALRSNGAVLLSLVAAPDGQMVGHTLYSPASVGDVGGSALGPMAVLCAAPATLACGLLPAIAGTRRTLAGSLAGSGRSQVSGRRSASFTLAGVQVALAVMLLAGVGLCCAASRNWVE